MIMKLENIFFLDGIFRRWDFFLRKKKKRDFSEIRENENENKSSRHSETTNNIYRLHKKNK